MTLALFSHLNTVQHGQLHLSVSVCLSFFLSFLLLFSEKWLISPRLFTVGSPQICHQLESHSVSDSADLRISAGKFLCGALHTHVLGYKIENLTVSDSGLNLTQSGPKTESASENLRLIFFAVHASQGLLLLKQNRRKPYFFSSVFLSNYDNMCNLKTNFSYINIFCNLKNINK